MQDCCNANEEEYASRDEDILMWKYFEEFSPFMWILESYNHVYDEGFKHALEARTIKLSHNREASFVFIRIDKPTIDHTTALLEEREYSGNMIVKLRIRNADGEVIDETPESVLMRIPIPVRSKYCRSPFTHPRDVRMVRDPGCYFVNRQRRIVIPYEKLRWNTLRLSYSERKQTYAVDQIEDISHITTIASTTQTRLFISLEPKSGVVPDPVVMTSIDKSAIDRSGEKEAIGDANFNVLEQAYLAYYYLTGEDPSDIRDIVLSDFSELMRDYLPEDHYNDCWLAFAPTRLQLLTNKNLDELVTRFQSTVAKSLTGRAQQDAARKVMTEGFLPAHTDFDTKIKTLVAMTCRLLQCFTRKISAHDPNSWSRKCVYSPAIVLLDLFRRKLSGALIKLNGETGLHNSPTAQSVLNLFNKHNIGTRFLLDFMNDAGSKGHGGAAKRGGKKKSLLITQEVMPDNTLELYLALIKTKKPIDKHVPRMEPRNLIPSSFRVQDAAGITDNDLAGLVDFQAAFIEYTLGSSPAELKHTLLTRKINGDTLLREERDEEHTIPVWINSSPAGYVGECGYKNIRLFKRYGWINRKCTIVDVEGVIEIYCGPNRPVRPALVVGESGYLRIYENNLDWKRMSFSQLIKYGYVEYIDPLEFESPRMRVAQTFASFDNEARWMRDANLLLGTLEKRGQDVAAENLRRQIANRLSRPLTHADIHPTASYGIISGLVTFLASQQPCRTAFDMKMITQIIGQVMDDPYAIEAGFSNPYIFTRLIDTGLARAMGTDDLHGGVPVVVAILPDDKNQEDAIIINKTAVDTGIFRYHHQLVVKRTLDNESQHFGRFPIPDKNQSLLRFINPSGLPSPGAYLTNGSQVISKFEEVEVAKGDIKVKTRKNLSAYLSPDESGVVRDVVTYYSSKSSKASEAITAKVLISSYRRLQDGDKVTIDQAQKFVVSTVLPQTDMPYTTMVVNDGTGNKTVTMYPSAMHNPMCFPTRMTDGTLSAPVYRKALSGTGKIFNAGPHRRLDFFGVCEALKNRGFNRYGEDYCINGVTGEEIACPIFIGPRTVSILKHIGELKMQYRPGTGPVNKITRQAKADEEEGFKKGEKYSEYERVASLKGGMHFIIDERMNTSCDAFTIVVCLTCHNYARFDPEKRSFTCRECLTTHDGKSAKEKFGKYMMPYTSIYEQFILAPLHTHIKPVFMTRDEYLGNVLPAAAEEADVDDYSDDEEQPEAEVQDPNDDYEVEYAEVDDD